MQDPSSPKTHGAAVPSLVEIKSWDRPSDEKTCIDSENREMTRHPRKPPINTVPMGSRIPPSPPICLSVCLPACLPTNLLGHVCMYVSILELDAQLLLSQLANAHVSLSCLILLTNRVRPFLIPLPHRATGANRNIKVTKQSVKRKEV